MSCLRFLRSLGHPHRLLVRPARPTHLVPSSRLAPSIHACSLCLFAARTVGLGRREGRLARCGAGGRGSLDNSSPVTSKPDAFFSELKDFREANKEECIHSDPEPRPPGVRESRGVEEEHACVYCYHVNRRLFLVPSDPGVPCRLCKTPRDQRGPETLLEPAHVRVSIPLSVLHPPHQYRIHRRKSFDASDTLALPRHCLLGWDIFPPKSEKSSAPRSLDLWSCVSSEAQHRKLPAASPSYLSLLCARNPTHRLQTP